MPAAGWETFSRSVGGFAGNVCTGLARLGVATSIVSAVGDDGQGRYARAFLAGKGVDVQTLSTHPSLRTALASTSSARLCPGAPLDPSGPYRDPLELDARAP